jgi:hypothetical protein
MISRNPTRCSTLLGKPDRGIPFIWVAKQFSSSMHIANMSDGSMLLDREIVRHCFESVLNMTRLSGPVTLEKPEPGPCPGLGNMTLKLAETTCKGPASLMSSLFCAHAASDTSDVNA